MISHLTVKDFAIINEMDVDFYHGLNIITGETGAGKSIVIEAVSLALGSRADTAFVRSGKEKAIIQLVIEDCSEKAANLLNENDIPVDEHQIVIKREISATGKSVCRVNNQIVSVSFLNSLCKHLADIHGQYDHQSLLDPELHINLLDLYHRSEILPVKELVEKLYAEYKELTSKLHTLLSNAAEYQRKRDFMSFELKEIKEASLIPGEDAELESQLLILQNSERIYSNLNAIYTSVYEESPSVLENLSKAHHKLQEIATFSSAVSALLSDFNDVYYKLEDICHEVRTIRDDITFSEEELDTAISRIDLINKLKLKYGGSVDKILEYQTKLEEDLSVIENIDEAKEKYSHEISVYEEQLQLACMRLSKLRKEAAIEFEDKLKEQLLELSFNSAEFKIDFSEQPSGYTANGIDLVEFLISTNKGEPLKPLAKIASGGEMSRIMLAFKKIIGDYDNIPTMIFDEIDAGISGVAASVVGKKLKEIAQKHQIICITHLPQITACGQYNFKIVKNSDEESTYTTVVPLSEQEKVEEIARLLGGLNITEATIKSAQDLIAASR
ncbi:DNA repair protein RecN [Clostridium aminobutyricum]|uniref:DNA repair protein RecN n=1 Tax=Clostridium aminobutyricum TaxID=33953 RepID=A0A939D7S6_CLOAM|nr:DNA repair protein RecN [Clostridium aminobutyricum]MBN7772665.1 DNA repair protein RecN [Clostridium aminobutyricum]